MTPAVERYGPDKPPEAPRTAGPTSVRSAGRIGAPGAAVVILAIDPGATSGAALHYGGRPRLAWTCATAAERAEVIATALRTAADLGAPLVVVMERWTAGGARGHAQIVGLGAQAGRWLEALELAGIPAADVVRVYPQTWRAVLAPMPRKTGAAAKASARRVAAGYLGREVLTDAAEATCIALWAAQSDDVEAMAARLQRRAERERRRAG